MGRSTGAIKYILFVINTLWAIFSILLILFGGFGWDAMPQIYAISIVVLGSVIFLVSLFGCFGAMRESARAMWTYVSFLLILTILHVVFMCLNTRDVFKRYALQGVEDLWHKEIVHPGSMDTTQVTYACCGRYSPEDYVKINRLPGSSCCKENNCINPLNLYQTGCLRKVEEAFADEATITSSYEWGVLAFDLILLVLATILAIHYTNRKRRYNY